MKIVKNAERMREEVLPFWVYQRNKKKILSKLGSDGIEATLDQFDHYYTLPKEKILERLAEERQRATAMDEKTFKLTLSLTVGLTLLGTTIKALEEGIHSEGMKTAFEVMVLGSVVYVLIGGMVALSALKTLPSYGYGSYFAIENNTKSKGPAMRALVLQEKMNNVRHLRNEASYQCLRNGMILLLCTVAIHFFGDMAAGAFDSVAHRISERIGNFWTTVVNFCGL